MSERKTITVKVFESESWPVENTYSPGSLKAFSAWLAEITEKIPPEYRDEACLEVNATSFYDSPYVEIEVSYARPETDDEMKTRLHHEKEQARARAQHQERQERELLAALTAKYKGG